MQNSVLDFRWQFSVTPYGPTTPYGPCKFWVVQVSFERPDTATGQVGIGKGRKELIEYDTTISGVVKTAWLLIELMDIAETCAKIVGTFGGETGCVRIDEIDRAAEEVRRYAADLAKGSAR